MPRASNVPFDGAYALVITVQSVDSPVDTNNSKMRL